MLTHPRPEMRRRRTGLTGTRSVMLIGFCYSAARHKRPMATSRDGARLHAIQAPEMTLECLRRHSLLPKADLVRQPCDDASHMYALREALAPCAHKHLSRAHKRVAPQRRASHLDPRAVAPEQTSSDACHMARLAN